MEYNAHVKEDLLKPSEKKARALLRSINIYDPAVGRTTLEKLRQGSHPAYDKIFRRYYTPVLMYIGSLLKNRQEAEDITQNVFAELWANHERIDPEKNIKGYLFRIAKHLIISHFRKSKYVTQYQNFASTLEYFEVDADQETIQKELMLLAEMTIENMPPKRRAVIKMRLEKDMSFEQIAKELGIGVESARTHYKLGRADIENTLAAFLLLLLMVR